MTSCRCCTATWVGGVIWPSSAAASNAAVSTAATRAFKPLYFVAFARRFSADFSGVTAWISRVRYCSSETDCVGWTEVGVADGRGGCVVTVWDGLGC